MSEYDFQAIEKRWQDRWREARTFEVNEDPSRPKFYCLEMLPYPSGDIHVGHVRNYCITDVISRCKTMRPAARTFGPCNTGPCFSLPGAGSSEVISFSRARIEPIDW